MARDDPTIYMRIPSDLKERLDEEALKSGRSLTAEVVGRLRGSLESSPDGAVLAPVLARMEAIVSQRENELRDAVRLLAPVLLRATEGLDGAGLMPGDPSSRTVDWWRSIFAPASGGIDESQLTPDEMLSLAITWTRIMQASLPDKGADGSGYVLVDDVEGDAIKASQKKILVGNLGADSPSIYDDIARKPASPPHKPSPIKRQIKKTVGR